MACRANLLENCSTDFAGISSQNINIYFYQIEALRFLNLTDVSHRSINIKIKAQANISKEKHT